MKVLVTGAAGYIGSAVCWKLLERGHEVVALDDLSCGVLAAIPAGVTFHRVDISNTTHELCMREAAKGCDAIVHLAAKSDIPLCEQQPHVAYKTNCTGSFHLLECARHWNTIQRVIYASTAAVYGAPDAMPITEDAPIRPTCVYGASKAAFEQALTWLGTPWVAFRFFNVVGATENCWARPYHRSRLVSVALDAARGRRAGMVLNGDDFPVADGTCVRDYIHVDDIAEAIVLALDSQETGVFNLGIGRGYSNLEVLQTVEQVTGLNVPYSIGPRRPGDPPVLVADASLAREKFGWVPRYTSLAQMVATCWRWEP